MVREIGGRYGNHTIVTVHDVALDGVDFRSLPYADNTFDGAAYDPPYVSVGGDDFIDNTAFATNDEIRTGAGNDAVKAGAGNDDIRTGAGDDRIILNEVSGDDVIDGWVS